MKFKKIIYQKEESSNYLPFSFSGLTIIYKILIYLLFHSCRIRTQEKVPDPTGSGSSTLILSKSRNTVSLPALRHEKSVFCNYCTGSKVRETEFLGHLDEKGLLVWLI